MKSKTKISMVVFLGGFIIDIFTLTKIEAFYGNLILFGYLILALFSIIIFNLGDYKDIKNKFFYRVYWLCPFITQFSFGALFSGFVIYYTTSGSFSASWPFLLSLYLLFVANEKFKKFYEKFEFQLAVFFASFMSLNIYFLPIISKKVGDDIFIASGFLTLFFSYWIIRYIFKILPVLKKKKLKIIFNISFVFVLFNTAYFFEAIPPVPLSSKKIELAHSIEKIEVDGKIEYIIKKNEKIGVSFFEKSFQNIFYKNPEDKIYVFASVHAPRDLQTEIYHNWEFFDEKKKHWISVNRIKYKIIGGRDGGYRGHSNISNAQDGKWRVRIENSSGFLIGVEKFQVKNEQSYLKYENIFFDR